ncbi:MAG: hypothetical protein SWH78_09630 [Thermodesulfobacteriota bacterium]|nr:hypothetical protein [Thermodesulfobacteriota bacterium]
MWTIIGIVIVIGLVVYLFMRQRNKEELPHAHYVCDHCGERDCICRREDSQEKSS